MSIEPHSNTWKAVEDWCRGEIRAAHLRLEQIGVDPDETQQLRGRIRCARDLLALAEPAPKLSVAPGDYGLQT